MSRKYVILNSDEIDSVDFSKVDESRNSLRFNVLETKTFVKFEGSTPSFLNGKTQYSHSEILIILDTTEWTDPNLPPA